jgi:predicted RNA-binding Zn-ribbon protein involved in translation (DUF1610 family)
MLLAPLHSKTTEEFFMETIRCPRCDQEIDAEGPACPACGHIHSGTLQCRRHPDRAAVGVCVICGDALCDECDATDEMHHACPDHYRIPVIEGWAQVYTTSDDMEADLIKENLQAEGIDAAVLSQKDRSFSVELGDLSPVRVLVPAYAYIEGSRVLGQHMDGAGEVAFACPSCGEAFEPGDTACRACGTPLSTPAA